MFFATFFDFFLEKRPLQLTKSANFRLLLCKKVSLLGPTGPSNDTEIRKVSDIM